MTIEEIYDGYKKLELDPKGYPETMNPEEEGSKIMKKTSQTEKRCFFGRDCNGINQNWSLYA